MESVINVATYLLNLLSDLGSLLVNLLFRDFFGFPLAFYLFGSGLITYLVAKILLELIT